MRADVDCFATAAAAAAAAVAGVCASALVRVTASARTASAPARGTCAAHGVSSAAACTFGFVELSPLYNVLFPGRQLLGCNVERCADTGADWNLPRYHGWLYEDYLHYSVYRI